MIKEIFNPSLSPAGGGLNWVGQETGNASSSRSPIPPLRPSGDVATAFLEVESISHLSRRPCTGPDRKAEGVAS